ncbi:MAG: hypothetical protein ABIN37_08265, partial [Burkholderiaceae bacterium]
PSGGVRAGLAAWCAARISPSIFSKTGIGTANAVAEARITRAEVAGWCATWEPNDKGCLQRQLAAEDLKKVYRATANCTAGRINPIDGKAYSLAGVWDNSDIGGGRSKWRDAAGKVVGRDNASGGLGISQQWEELCPASAKTAKGNTAAPATKAAVAAATKAAVAAAPAPAFNVGQVVLARYGSNWVKARVERVRQSAGPQGPQTHYEVRLENGQRGVVPARMLRVAQ